VRLHHILEAAVLLVGQPFGMAQLVRVGLLRAQLERLGFPPGGRAIAAACLTPGAVSTCSACRAVCTGAAAEQGNPDAAALRAALLADPALRPEALKALTRVARGAALSLRNRDYVYAERVLGAGDGHILLRHILPNVLPPLAVFMSFHLGGAILASSALSFIGLGAQPPTAEWGAMIGAGREFFLIAWWYVTIPGIAILLTALSTNIVGDALRDVLDPRR
jgi:hypothetical protein